MINVLQVADKLSLGGSTIHGVTRLFSWWVPRFDKNRFQVQFCVLRNRDEGGEYLEKAGAKITYLNRGKFDPLTLVDLLRLVRRENTDIFHLHGYGSTTFGRVCGALTKKPCIIHEHMYDKHIPLYQKAADYFLRGHTARAIAVSRSVKEFFISYRFVPEARVRVIYNGVPLEVFNKLDSLPSPNIGKTWKSKLNIPASHKLIAIVGRLHPIKGHRYFLEAARSVLQEFNHVTFVVVGDGELMGSLKQQCRRLEIEDSVRFIGHCNDVPTLLSETDISVNASLSEGFGLTILEAMAARCAIVTTNVGGPIELIVEGLTGFFISPEDPKALAKKILTLLRDPNLCQEMANRAKQASAKYNINNTVTELELCYLDAVGK